MVVVTRSTHVLRVIITVEIAREMKGGSMKKDDVIVADLQKMGCSKCGVMTAHSVKLVGENPQEYKLLCKCQVCGEERDMFVCRSERIGIKVLEIWDNKITSASFPILKDGLIRRVSIGTKKRENDALILEMGLR